jgi:hypothetical protein
LSGRNRKEGHEMKLLATIVAAALGGVTLAQQQNPEIRNVGSLAPFGFAIPRGNLLAGGFWDLVYSDNSPVVLSTQFSANGYPVQIILEGRLSLDPAELGFAIESHSTSPNIEQTVALWDFDARNWVTLGSDVISAYDSVREYAVVGPVLRFSAAGTGRVRALIAYRPVGPNYGAWQARIDAAGWRYTQ